MTPSTQVATVQGTALDNRRLHLRRKIQRVAYVHVDQDNGGILLDLSEGGMNFQGVAGLMEGEPCHLKFTLPATPHRIEVDGQVVWSNSSRKGGGIRFVDLPEDMRQQIREWLSADDSNEDRPAQYTKSAAVLSPAGEAPAATLTEDSPRHAPSALHVPVPVDVAAPASTAPLQELPAALDNLVAASAAVPSAVVAADADTPSDLPMIGTVAGDSSVDALGNTPPHISVAGPQPTGAAVALPVSSPVPAPTDPIRVAAHVTEQQQTVPPRVEPASPSTDAAPALIGRASQVNSRSAFEPTRRPIFQPTATIPSFEPPKLASLQDLKETRVRVSQTGVLALTGGLVAVVALVGIYHFGRSAGRSQDASAADANKATIAPAGAASASKNFMVEVVDMSNRRWILANGNGDAPVTVIGKVAVTPSAAPPPVASAGSRNTPASASTASPNLAMQSPRWLKARPQPSLEAPAVAGMSSPVPLYDSHSVVAPPELPKPVAVEAPAAKLASSPQPVLVRSVQPVYPAEARAAHVTGAVRINATIGRDGVPSKLTVLSGDPRLVTAALVAVQLWRYSPALLDGRPAESQIIIAINFQLN